MDTRLIIDFILPAGDIRQNLRKENWLFIFVLLIPVINGLATITTNYFQPSSFNPGTIRAFLIGSFLMIFLFGRYRFNLINLSLLLFLSYLFILCLFSSNQSLSFYQFLKVFISTLLFPVGYYYINSTYRLHLLNLSYLVVLVIFILDFVISNLFGLGYYDYLDDTVSYGVSGVNITKSMLVILAISPLFVRMFRDKTKRSIIIAILLVALVIIILGVKRTVLISTAGAILVYFWQSPRKTKTVKTLMVVAVIMLIASPLFFGVLKERLTSRQSEGAFAVETYSETEARVNELKIVSEAFINSSLGGKLFGTELFNDRQLLASERMLHMDYMILISGSGVVGLIWYLTIFWLIVVKARKYFRLLKKEQYYSELWAILCTIVTIALLMGIAGSIYSIMLRSLIMMYLGAILGVMSSAARQKYFALTSEKDMQNR